MNEQTKLTENEEILLKIRDILTTALIQERMSHNETKKQLKNIEQIIEKMKESTEKKLRAKK